MDDERLHIASDGYLTQGTRSLPALDTQYFRLDERSLAELINTATALSRLLTYFDEGDTPHLPPQNRDKTGAWEAFFKHDVTFLLAEIAAIDANAEYRQSRLKSQRLVPLIVAQATRLWNWHQRARDLALLAPPESVEAALFATLDQPQANDLRGVISEPLMAEILHQDESVPKTWQAEGNASHYPHLTLFSTLSRISGQIAHAAEQYLKRSLVDKHDHSAHTGLFLAFVRLLQKSQVDLNRMTDRHLEFYFRKVLRSNPRDAEPDRTTLVMELAQGARPEPLPEGTAFVAGSGSGPTAIIYESERPLLVTSARTRAFKAVAVDRIATQRDSSGNLFVDGVSIYPCANSADGKGTPLPDPAAGWSPFGPEITNTAPICLGIASEVLNLAGGTRHIAVTLGFDDQCRITLNDALIRYRDAVARRFEGDLTDQRFARFLNDAFQLSLTTGTGFYDIAEYWIEISAAQENRLVLQFTLPDTAPAITANTALHAHPLLRITLNPDARAFAYSAFHQAKLNSADITVDVDGLKQLTLKVNGQPVAPGKPFFPFGPSPLPGAHLTLSVQELAQKKPDSLAISMAWTGLPVPPEDFASHYAGYGRDVSHRSFRASLDAGTGQSWHQLKVAGTDDATPLKEAGLFPPVSATSPALNKLVVPRLDWVHPNGSEGARGPDDAALGSYRLTLTAPDMGFGAQIYPRLVAKAALANSEGNLTKFSAALGKIPKSLKSVTTKVIKKKPAVKPPKVKLPENAVIPNPPLQPMLSNVTLSYSAHVSAAIPGRDQPVKLLDFGAFGEVSETTNGQFIRTDLNIDGRLMIGLDRVTAPESLTLFFNIRDSQAATWTRGDAGPRPGITWSYFSAHGWRKLPDMAIIADETEELTTHGVIEIFLPADAMRTRRYSTEPLVWLSISYQGDRSRFGKIVDINTQAVTAVRRSPGTSVPAPALLPPGSIKRFFTARPAIAKITQPLPTEGGRRRESPQMHRTRLSERLGHKMRAIRPQDFTRMVLDQFPDIGGAKCRHLGAGQVELIVTPRRSADNVHRYPRVALHQRNKIARWLAKHTGQSANRISVRNPSYEDVRVQAFLLPQGTGNVVTLAEVRKCLTRLVAPWMLDSAVALPIGQHTLEVATVTATLEEMPGLAKVMGLSLVHSFRNRTDARAETGRYGIKDSARALHAADNTGAAYIRGATPASVLVPALRHDISFLPPRMGIGDLTIGRDFVSSNPKRRDAYRNTPSELPYQVAPTGIGDLCIGKDLIITAPADAIPPTLELEIRPHPLDAVFLTK